MNDAGKRLLIGIAGGTGSGKTTVARELVKNLENESRRVAVISFDNYYRDQSTMPIEKRGLTNYDHPDSLESVLLAEHLTDLSDGKVIEMPEYDFSIHNRIPETKTIEPADVIIVEGILLFADPDLVRLFDLKVYVDTPDDIRFIRRLKRDVAERGRSMESVIEQYEQTVRPRHMKFVEPTKKLADLVIAAGGYDEMGMQTLLKTIEEMSVKKLSV